MRDLHTTPARESAAATRAEVFASIDGGQHFLVEAGAGSGKTYSLIEALQHVIRTRGAELLRNNQRIACITYTNVACEEIESRTDKHPVIYASTIHAFLWLVIKDFQSFLREQLPKLGKWSERIAEQGELGSKPIEYNLGYPKIEADRVLLHHTDVIALAARLLAYPKFLLRLRSAFPIVFIDEYQDTNKELAAAIETHLISVGQTPQIGLFGDHWQAIYESVCGRIQSKNLRIITKNANFRSAPAVVKVLNAMRSELPQEVDDPNDAGSAQAFHTNEWAGQRRTDNHWQGDMPPEAAAAYQREVTRRLTDQGWNFNADATKVLMLTHRVLAAQQGYGALVDAFTGNTDLFMKKEDAYVKFFAEVVEPAVQAFERKRFGELAAVLGGPRPVIGKAADKRIWSDAMTKLMALRQSASIGDVVDFLRDQPIRQLLPPKDGDVKPKPATGDDAEQEPSAASQRWDKIKVRPYLEMSRLVEFIEDRTPFSTKHGVKGAEFENVLVVVGRGWNKYDFGQFLEIARNPAAVPAGRRDAFERNRNLLYVACSRPRRNLAVLFTQRLSPNALLTLQDWMGANQVHSLPAELA